MGKKQSKNSYGIFLLLFLYFLLAGGISILIGLSNLKGDFIRPPLFTFFRTMICVGQGIFFSFLFSGIIFFSKKSNIFAKLNIPLLVLLFAWYGIYAIWAIVRGSFGLDLSIDEIRFLITDPGELSAIGISFFSFYCIIAGLIFYIIIFTLLSKFTVSHISPGASRSVMKITLFLFILINLITRSWVTYHVNRNQYAVMALDAYIPFQIKTEYLLPRFRRPDVKIKNLEMKERNELYFRHIKSNSFATESIPGKYNILWIVIDSLRFDSINEFITPNIWKYRKKFQIQLGKDHWSGGNATQFGIFSMLSGISSYHMQNFFKRGIKFTFLKLLLHNGYHLRVGKKIFWDFRRLYNFLPENISMPPIDKYYAWEEDIQMTDYFLNELRLSPYKLRFDFLTMDATHWPYYHPASSRIFTPSPYIKGGVWVIRSTEEVDRIRNNYKNALHAIDSQVGRILDYFSISGGFDNTIIIITGDHGEEFQERGQLTHTGVLNDYQARVALWIHFPSDNLPPVEDRCRTVHIDIIPTLLDFMGFKQDILYTQGTSIFQPCQHRPMIILSEQGNYYPLYHAFVTDLYISRWWHRKDFFVFSGIQRRDGVAVQALDNWLGEVKKLYYDASSLYQNLPDISKPPPQFFKNR